MNRRKFLAMLAALPIVGRLAPKIVTESPLTATGVMIQQPVGDTPIIELIGMSSISHYVVNKSGVYDMYTYPTKRLDLQIVDATTPGDVPDTPHREQEPDRR